MAARKLAAAFVGGFGATTVGIAAWKQYAPDASAGSTQPAPPAAATPVAAVASPAETKEAARPPPLVVEAAREDRLESWQERWEAGNTRWHLPKPNPVLKRYDAELFGPPEEERGAMCVLFPLCGNKIGRAHV